MDSEVRRLVERFDHHDAVFATEGMPAAVFKDLRGQCPSPTPRPTVGSGPRWAMKSWSRSRPTTTGSRNATA